MTRAFLYVGCILALGACTQRMICPAYQSAFIHDQAQLSKRFSYFENDTTPKYLTVSKNKYLVIPEQSYRKKLRTLQTVPMKSIHAVVPDSLKSNKPDSTLLSKDSTLVRRDSTKVTAAAPVDSTYQITIDKEVRVLRYYMDSSKYYVQDVKYTLDQDIYMWYFRDVLVLPDVQLALMADKGKAGGPNGKGTNGKKEKKKFSFKNLFKKKQKDSTSVAPVVSGAEGVTDTTPPKEKKGLFKKKKAPVDPTPAKKVDPAEKKDDGF